MRWLGLLPLTLFVLVVLGDFVVTFVVAWGERNRRLRNPLRVRNGFRPVVIQGGKAQAPPGAEETPESRIA